VNPVRPKKRLGQHFLADRNIAAKIVGSLTFGNYTSVLEIGPGMGVLSAFLLEKKGADLKFIEIDSESVEFLSKQFPGIEKMIIRADILGTSLRDIFDKPFAVIGNLPYNISSQIFFKILENRDLVCEVVCMVQREVAARIVSPPGSKEYGILSVLLQAYYNTEILFNVSPGVFRPPPAVMSSVMRLSRNDRSFLECDESFFLRIVKTAFNQRRKMLSNSLKAITGGPFPGLAFSDKRPEQLSVDDFIKITLQIQSAGITGNIKNNLKPDEGVKFDNII